MQELIGWTSSFILVFTITRQIYKQWKENTSHGVSKWLFIGQLFSSAGFITYSWLVHNWVFVVTNVLLMVTNITGLLILLHHRKRERQTDSLLEKKAA